MIVHQGGVYNDDRMYIFYICRCTATLFDDGHITVKLHHDEIPARHRWAVVTYRNTARYPIYRLDDFDSEVAAISYRRDVEPETPLISLGGKSPKLPLSYDAFVLWKEANGLTEYDYRTMYSDGGTNPFELVTLPQGKTYGSMKTR